VSSESDSAFYRISKVQDLTGVSRQTLYRWRQKGKGPKWVKPGSIVLYPKDAFWEWADAESDNGSEENDDPQPPAS
jgi:predicted DNA-binding transcriptional regulator AlpA